MADKNPALAPPVGFITKVCVRTRALSPDEIRAYHFGAAEWHIPEQNSKTGKPHIVYLSAVA